MTEGKELTHHQSGAVTTSQAMNDTVAMLTMFRDLALDPSIDAEKLRVIADVANTQQDRAQKQEFYAAKASALLEMPIIDKRGKITIADRNAPNDRSKDRVQGTFAKWPDLQRAITPVLSKFGLVLTHDIGHDGSTVIVTPVLAHRNGYVERGAGMPLPLDTSGGKNNTQGAGSAASYGKRHTTVGILGLRVEDSDDDGALMATEDEPLNDQQQRLVTVAEERAAAGEYAEWFPKLEPKDRAWLVQTKRDAIFRAGAAEPPAGSAGPTPSASPAPSPPPPPRQQATGHDVTTPSGWAAQFKDDCKAAKSMEDLMRVKTRGDKGLGRLSENNLKLYDECDAEFEEARARLSDI